jgi:hypothetical protein
MKKLLLPIVLAAILPHLLFSQRIAPAPIQQQPVLITGGTIHLGNGQVIENGAVLFDKGKIIYSGVSANVPANTATVISAQGKHVYPGLIAPNSNIGLSEIELVRATNDYGETGTYNPGTRSLIAYNYRFTSYSYSTIKRHITRAGGSTGWNHFGCFIHHAARCLELGRCSIQNR